ncbi:MAG: hypothetical protein K8R74_08150 [Bacteroidales bacterium]|nr:hypothetical protein [Bacteroidales bacterium]
MKKYVLLLILSIIGWCAISHATVWRLNNIPGVDADFTIDLQDAIDNVTSGDTIYVEQSPFSYGSAVISKKIILIGAGYWLSENDTTQASIEHSMVEELVFNPGSEGSEITGLHCYKVFPDKTSWQVITIYTDNISIRRNYLSGRMNDCYMSGCSGILIELSGDRSNINIEQNWLECYHTMGPSGSHIGVAVYINGVPTNVFIRNNFIKSTHYAIFESVSYTTTGLTVSNNVIWGEIYTYISLHINNILLEGNFYNGSGGLTANNLCNADQYPGFNNNQRNVDMSTVFVDHDLYIDKGYILAPGSLAIGAGFSGGDCGVFGYGYGGKPYVLSGIPDIPAIFDINFSTTVFPADTTHLQVDVKAKSNN